MTLGTALVIQKLNDEGFTPGNELSRDNYTVGANGNPWQAES